MAKIFVNRSIDLAVERAWTAQNGATRTTLVLVSKVGSSGPTIDKECYNGSIGKLAKGNHAFIYINPPSAHATPDEDSRVLGIFLNTECGFELKEGEEWFAGSSVGGPDNSESKFGVYEVGALVYVPTYMNRKPASYFKLTNEGWIKLTTVTNNAEGTV